MKITQLTTLKHKLQWLLLLAALLGVSQGAFSGDASIALFTIKVYYNGSDHYYNVYRSHSTCTNPDNYPCNTDNTTWISSTTDLGEITSGGSIYLRGYVWRNNTTQYNNGFVRWWVDNGSTTDKALSKKGDYNGWCNWDPNNWYRYDTDSNSDYTVNTSGLSSGTHYIKFVARIPNSNNDYWANNGCNECCYAIKFTVPQTCTAPTPTTANTPSAKGTTTATLTGTYPTTSGYCSITEKGICYGTSSDPTSEHKDNTSGSGSISHSATGLSEGTTYYYRAYVKSGGSTLYGANKSFKTDCTATSPTLSATPPNADNITCSSATLGGQVTNKGIKSSCSAQTLTYRGVKVYSNSACTDTYLVTTVNHETPNSTAAYTVTVPSGTLSSGTTYYYKSYATNATGTSYSTNYKSFTTKATPSAVDISISSPASATTLYLGTGDYPSVTQTVTASCDKGDTYLWSASPTTYTSSSCWSSTATRVEFTSTSSKSTTATFYHEGVYTATFNAGCGNTSDASKDAQTITVKPGHIYFDGPFFSGSGYTLTKHHLEINTSTDQFVYEWTADENNTDAENDFIISVGSKCLDAASSAYTLGNYADLNLSGLTIPTKSTGGGDNCNHNFRADIGTITIGERLKLTVAYTGVNESGIPKYNVTLEKVCSNPTVQTVSGTATICDGSSTNVTVSSSQSNYTYKLYKDGSATATTQTGSTGSALNFPVSDAGTYTVHAYYTSGSDAYCNADMSGNAVVSVDATSDAGAISGGSSKVCLGVKRTIKITGYTGTSIQWHGSNENDFTPDESTAIDGATNATYYAPIGVVGTMYYKAVVKNGVCTSATSSQARVTVIPDASLASATISSSPTAICSGSSATASITGAVLGGGTTAWSIDGTGVSINSSNGAITTTAASAGTVPVITYTITDGCGTGEEPISLSASPLTINGVSINRTPSTVHGYEVTTLSASPAKNVTWHIQSKPGGITTNQAYFVKDDGKSTASDVSASSIIFKGKGTSDGGNSYTVRATDGTCTTDETFSVINDATESCN